MPAAETSESGKSAGAPGSAPPRWVVAAVVLLGGLVVGSATLGAYLRLRPANAEQAAAREEEPVRAGAPQGPGPDRRSHWQSLLQTQECPALCAGGIACEGRSRRCTSGFTCLPGTGYERLGGDEKWALRLWAVLARGPRNTTLDPCRTDRDFWVCLSGTTQCASQREACKRRKLKAWSAKGLNLTAAHFSGKGMRLDVREGGADGRIVGQTRHVTGLQRGGLCTGFKVGVVGEDLILVTYFLTPR